MIPIVDYQQIKTSITDRILTVVIDRPAVHNALSPQTNFELAAAFDDFEKDPDLWVAIITGSGELAFSVGGDISSMVDAESEDDYPIPTSGYGGLTNRFTCNKPIIAAVNGMALGGGFETVLACDLVVAAEHASFGLPEPKIGTAAVGSGMHRLVRDIGRKPAMEILLTGNPIDAHKALQLGLINKVVAANSVMETAIAYAKEILQSAPLAIQATKQCVQQGLEYPSVDSAMQAQLSNKFSALETMLHSQDIREGLRAFMEKRRPEWNGK